MVRRELLGILLISLVASTLLVYYLRRASPTPVDILSLNVPAAIPAGEKSMHEISVGLVMRRKVESLAVDFDCLLNATGEDNRTGEVEESINILRSLLESVGGPYTVDRIQIDGGSGLLYDFSRAFSALAPRPATLSSSTVYCVAEIDRQTFAFRAVSDFFVNRNASISSLTLSRNEVPETYLTTQAGEASAQGKLPIMNAPPLGEKIYNGTRIDDRISVRMLVNSIGVPSHTGILEVLRVYADGNAVMKKGLLIPPRIKAE